MEPPESGATPRLLDVLGESIEMLTDVRGNRRRSIDRDRRNKYDYKLLVTLRSQYALGIDTERSCLL